MQILAHLKNIGIRVCRGGGRLTTILNAISAPSCMMILVLVRDLRHQHRAFLLIPSMYTKQHARGGEKSKAVVRVR